VVCLEISREVVEACKECFSPYNGNIFEDKRFKIVIIDARQYFNVNNKLYDLIISEPSNPWITGVSNMFTLECFQQLKKKLSSGGIVCQWIHYYNMNPDDLKMVLRTFREVFPHSSAWSYISGDMMLIGSTKPAPINYRALVKLMKNRQIREDLEKIDMLTPEKLISGNLLDNDQITEYTKHAGINTDDKPVLEFSAPKSLFRATSANNLVEIYEAYPIVIPPVSNLLIQTSEGTFYEHLNLMVNLSNQWIRQWAGFWVKRSFEDVSDIQDDDTRESIFWGYGKRIDYLNGEKLLILEGVEENEVIPEQLKTNLLEKYGNDIFTMGQITLNNHVGYWVHGKYHQKYNIEFTWFCPVNKTHYICRCEMNKKEDDVTTLLQEVLSATKCVH